MAREAVQIAFTVAGYYFGGPLGGMIGSIAGAYAGAALFPEKINGPRLNDLRTHISSYGAPIPILYGTSRLGGNIIWMPEKYTETESQSGGKGGPEITNFSYSVSYRAIICERARVLLKIYGYGRLYWDANQTDVPVVFYDGGPTQQPDPTEEAALGVGNVSARRGVASVVFTEQQLGEFGNAPPVNNYIVSAAVNQEIHRVNTWADDPMEDLGGVGSSGFYSPSVSYDGEFVYVSHYEGVAGPAGPTEYNTSSGWGDWVTDKYLEDGTFVSTTAITLSNVNVGNICTSTPNNGRIKKCREDSEVCFMQWSDGLGARGGVFFRNGVGIASRLGDDAVDDVDCISFISQMHSNGQRAYYMLGARGGECVVRRMFGPDWDDDNDPTYIITGHGEGNQFRIRSSTDGHVYVTRANYSGGNAHTWKFDEDLNLVQEWTWSGTAQYDSNDQAFFCGDLCVYRVGGDGEALLRVARVTDATPWEVVAEFAYSPGVNPQDVAGAYNLENGLAFVQDGMFSICEIEAGSESWADVIADIHLRCCGHTADQINVEDLRLLRCRGFEVADSGPVSGAAAINAALALLFADAVPSDGKIKYVVRGKPFAIEIPDDDLGAHLQGQEPPPKLQVVHRPDNTLPSHIVFNFKDPERGYLINSAQWKRQTGGSKDTRTVSTAVVLTFAEAQRIVETWGRIAWEERDGYIWYTTRKYCKYEPTDVMRVQGLDLRVTRKTEGAQGVIKWEGVKAAAYIVAQPGVGDGGIGFPEQEIPIAQETELVILDAPYIVDENRQAVITVGAQGALRRSWKGAALMKSIDGTNYEQILFMRDPSTMGYAKTLLGNFGGGNVIDELNTVDVEIGIGGGELQSYNDEQTRAGVCPYMIGAEVFYARDAELIAERTYRLSGLYRGRNGTEWAMRGHYLDDSPPIGERFGVLNTMFQIEALHAELGRTIYYKAVTSGRTISTATAVPFRCNGVSQAPYSPVHLFSGFLGVPGSADIRVEWVGRVRLFGEWLDFVDVPQDEIVEAYQVRIWEDGTYQTVVREETVTAGIDFTAGSPYYLYTAAKQAADGITVLPAISVAKIGRLGPGYSTLGTLPLFVPDDIPEYVPPNPDPVDIPILDIAFTDGAQAHSSFMGPNDRLALRFTTGSLTTTVSNPVGITGVEEFDPYVPREWVVSTIKGDFYTGNKNPGAYGVGQVAARFGVGTGTPSDYYPTLPVSTTCYVNVKRAPNGAESGGRMIFNMANVP